MKELINIELLARSIFLGFLYLTITKDDDTSIKNLSRFSLFYLVFYISSNFVGIDQNIITTAFTTKFIFTFLDDNIIKNKQEDKK